MKTLVVKDSSGLIEYLARKMDDAAKVTTSGKQVAKTFESSRYLPFEAVRAAIHQMVQRVGARMKLVMTGEASRNASLQMKKYASEFELEIAYAAEWLPESKTLFKYVNAAGTEDLIHVRRHVELPTLVGLMAKYVEDANAPLRKALFLENFILSMGDVGLISTMGEDMYNIIRFAARAETANVGNCLKNYGGFQDLCENVFLTMKKKKKRLVFVNQRIIMPNLSMYEYIRIVVREFADSLSEVLRQELGIYSISELTGWCGANLRNGLIGFGDDYQGGQTFRYKFLWYHLYDWLTAQLKEKGVHGITIMSDVGTGVEQSIQVVVRYVDIIQQKYLDFWKQIQGFRSKKDAARMNMLNYMADGIAEDFMNKVNELLEVRRGLGGTGNETQGISAGIVVPDMFRTAYLTHGGSGSNNQLALWNEIIRPGQGKYVCWERDGSRKAIFRGEN
ncbi:MAG: hypothetical protein ACXAEL_15860, partial [Candidatus Hodarchaeales archaeon]